MNDDAFWALMDELSRRSGDRDERLEWLAGELRRRPAADSVAFQVRLERACEAADTRALWRAADLIEGGGCSDDGFHYFTLWLVGQGRKTYESVLADPDALADVPEVRALVGRHQEEWDDDAWPEWEELEYVAQDVYDELTGQEDDEGEEFHAAVDDILDAEEPDADGERDGHDGHGDEDGADARAAGGPDGWDEDGVPPAGPRGPAGGRTALPRLAALFPAGRSV
ncbi:MULTISPECIES: DUF4240 domain-containing protein [unclassified Streptomyces]|uniref:DUF4240 domain-containing protein n=1 Tax=unclassified Streptomyces TaxID=2593676 RepID=UPI0036A63FBC